MSANYQVLDVVPHGLPMSLLDAIEAWSQHSITAIVTIRRDSMFCESAGVPAWVGVEYMGQAIAAWAGIQAREAGNPVKIGFLVSARRYETGRSHFPVGAQLKICATQVTDNISGLGVFECQIEYDGEMITAKLNVFMPDDVDQFLSEGNHD